MRRAKIICTLGPSTASQEAIEQLIHAGMDVARLNFSHGDYDFHRGLVNRVRAAADRAKKSVAILQDLQGPKIRTGRLKDHEPVLLKTGSLVTITPRDVLGTTVLISTTFQALAHEVGLDRLGIGELEHDRPRSAVGGPACAARRGRLATARERDPALGQRGTRRTVGRSERRTEALATVTGAEDRRDLAAVADARLVLRIRRQPRVVVAPGRRALRLQYRDAARERGEDHVAHDLASELGVVGDAAVERSHCDARGAELLHQRRRLDAERERDAGLVAVVADHQWDSGLLLGLERREDRTRHRRIADDEARRQRQRRVVERCQRLRRHAPQLGERRPFARQARRLREADAGLPRLRPRVARPLYGLCAIARWNRPWAGDDAISASTLCAPSLAEHRHLRRVDAERRDVAADPSQRGDLVEQAEVRGPFGAALSRAGWTKKPSGPRW